MGASRRTHRVASLLRGELARLLLHEVSDPSVRGLVVTDVDLSPDLKNARVYYTAEALDPKELRRGLQRVEPFLKKKAADALELRYVPHLEFIADTHTESVTRLMKAFEGLESHP